MLKKITPYKFNLSKISIVLKDLNFEFFEI